MELESSKQKLQKLEDVEEANTQMQEIVVRTEAEKEKLKTEMRESVERTEAEKEKLKTERE